VERGVRRINLGDIRKDERGWVVDLIQAAGLPIPSLAGGHAASLEPGAVRGNHYHEHATEWLLLFGGPVRILWQSPGQDVPREEKISAEAPAIFEIPPRHAHKIENLSSGPIFLMAFYDRDDPGVEPFEGFLTVGRE